MARRVPDQGEGQHPEAQPTANGLPGGASGIPDANAGAFSTSIVNPGIPESRAEMSADQPVVEVKRYRVLNDAPPGKTGYPVLYDGCLSHLPKGKIVLESAYDIEKLKIQGVILEQF